MAKVWYNIFCCEAKRIRGGVAQLGERTVRIRKVKGSNPSVSTKQALGEHFLLQRRFCRESVPLIRITKAPFW